MGLRQSRECRLSAKSSLTAARPLDGTIGSTLPVPEFDGGSQPGPKPPFISAPQSPVNDELVREAWCRSEGCDFDLKHDSLATFCSAKLVAGAGGTQGVSGMRDQLIFVSYRREDTGPGALALRAELDLRLDGAPIFVDLNRIQGGDLWSEVLDDALKKARILIALIGPAWLGPRPNGGYRIHDEDDWVRKECARALRHSPAAVLPVLLGGASMPRIDDLPEDLAPITSLQALPLRLDSWDPDLRAICLRMHERFGVRLRQEGKFLPLPSTLKRLVDPLSDAKLNAYQTEGELPGWRVETIHDVMGSGAVREFLKKTYRFTKDSFAFDFMHSLKSVTKKNKHHPIIEAKYADVSIRLSTWDAGHCITHFDIATAIAVDKLARRWRQREDAA